MADRTSKRTGNKPWKHVYGTDKAYTRRVDAARERGQYTEPGTPSGAPKKSRAQKRDAEGLPEVTPENPYGLPVSTGRSRRLPPS